ncbi:hypothetical protein [Cellulophaga tyrosinoxydans]|jgi:hypothetical protein|uniref:Uncharacterized protein n=1 Tax=Cellulophaga tyrosinoxydans TaxID=504486 RepID=A0A1W1ZV71_9FLAO|nr:hypothetical protein [Cellulophaga tyrosinoxydans]SMC51991.1 hypothetical protein SAMN05660703_1544 [Cellulophaga tyrosinoxydans]|tara:strand:- start:1798 stop:2097 length:300 start_codon:yes stop_codon:yes gene_type:complete
MSNTKDKKIRHLFLSLLFDGIGMLSYVIPGLGEVSDMIWAPISAWIMTRMYKGKIGQAAGLVTFVEELVPGLDFIPTFTIMWFYTYVFKSQKTDKIINA